jgi:Rod binding domain-containing protein
MDTSQLILTQTVAPPIPLDILKMQMPGETNGGLKVNGSSEESKKQLAKDFEAILLNRMLEQMKGTIGNWGFEKDGAAEQVQGIFWFFLAQHVADSGGLGLWKDVYRMMTETAQTNIADQSLNSSV